MNTNFRAPSCQSIASQSGSRHRNTGLLAIALLVCVMPMAQAFTVAMEAINVGAGEVVEFGGSPGGLASAPLLIDTNTIFIAPTGKLNMKNNALLVRQTPYATVYGYVVTGYNGGTWDGYGINSSTAANDPTHLTALGIIDNSEAQFASFEGRATLAWTETFVKFTLYGDANLDGLVDGTDLALMGDGTGWYHGDFNYSGTVDATDYALFEAGRDSQIGAPEPGSLSLLCAGVLGLAGCRRSRK